jgi:hypothetical protein
MPFVAPVADRPGMAVIGAGLDKTSINPLLFYFAVGLLDFDDLGIKTSVADAVLLRVAVDAIPCLDLDGGRVACDEMALRFSGPGLERVAVAMVATQLMVGSQEFPDLAQAMIVYGVDSGLHFLLLELPFVSLSHDARDHDSLLGR